jgi:hypothetical protein
MTAYTPNPIDHELLMLSAKAMGITLDYRHGSDTYYYDDPKTGREEWYPLGRIGQAGRMAVMLRIGMDLAGRYPTAVFFHPRKARFCRYHEDQDALGWEPAVCRAFTRAAAEIGRCLP